MLTWLRALGFASLFAALAAPALRADTVQATGPIVVLRLHEVNSDDYGLLHGLIVVGDSIGGYAEYRWGGGSCPGLTLGAEELGALQHAMNNPRILIEPRTKQGQGGNLCLVAFSLVLRSDVGALP